MERTRAYSSLTVKSLDEEQRIIEGIASTPSTDLMDDVVEPHGAEFAIPIPFLWQHDAKSPIGHVTAATVTDAGIRVRVQLARTDEPGELKNLLDKAWQSIKLGLVRGLSIGFKGIESEPIKGSYGIRFKRWRWLELSSVTVAANMDASITAIKQIDQGIRAASGTPEPVRKHLPPGVSGRTTTRIDNPRPREGTMFAQRIKDLENTRATRQARMQAILDQVAAEGRTKNESEQEEIDTLLEDVEKINRDIFDYQRIEGLAASAKAVDQKPNAKAASESRGAPTVTVNRTPVDASEKGIGFAQVVRTLWTAKQQSRDVESVARQLYPDNALVQKAAVAAGSTTGDTWGHELVGDEGRIFADFVEFLRPQTILGRFGMGGVPSLRRVPFRTPLIGQTGGGAGYWVGEGKPKPLTQFAFSRTTLTPLKVANIAVVTQELLRHSSPAAATLLRDALAAALRERLDIDFIDPDKAAVTDVSPASITNAATTIAASGTGDADDVRLDVRSAFQIFIDANNPPTGGVWIMSASAALALSLAVNTLGQPEFSGITMNGGTFFGLPVITSEHVDADLVVLVNASDVYLADEGGVRIDTSREASLQMDNAPGTQDSLTGTGTSLVSLWQTNTVGFLAEREINWALRRADAVVVLTGVAWGGAVTAPES